MKILIHIHNLKIIILSHNKEDKHHQLWDQISKDIHKSLIFDLLDQIIRYAGHQPFPALGSPVDKHGLVVLV
ncbi:MAG: hypothetical protein EZS28_031524 [Streblomastix strix]|uniref:Uncharacterized protein n=1 Tax=Streblomastix strix TaxID=222440 RepID=A0A5J4US53_9EUKA|nr:MAG: hypothetical protein EZS28_031524 [Streblomastix strix]